MAGEGSPTVTLSVSSYIMVLVTPPEVLYTYAVPMYFGGTLLPGNSSGASRMVSEDTHLYTIAAHPMH
jgi:hypothetical protein